MSPILLKQMRGMSMGFVDLLVHLGLLLMPAIVLALLVAILGTLILLEGNLPFAGWPARGIL